MRLLIVLAFLVTPFAASNHLNMENEETNSSKDSSDEVTISRKHFEIFDILGKGSYGEVYVVKKVGGSDDGKLYALKTTNITHVLEERAAEEIHDILLGEREVLEAVSDLPFATGLHYAWREGIHLFLIMDIGIGGCLVAKFTGRFSDANTSRKILSEMVVGIEALHNAGILQGDISTRNTVIDAEGRMMLTDFGLASLRSDDNSTNSDWEKFSQMSRYILSNTLYAGDQTDLIEMMKNMTDAQLPELKKHSYFNGVDWEMVAEKRSDPPYEPTQRRMNLEHPFDYLASRELGTDDMLDESIIELLRNYAYVAPEHRN